MALKKTLGVFIKDNELNAEYERRIQDKKRQIRVLDPKYLDLFVSEYKSLIRQ